MVLSLTTYWLTAPACEHQIENHPMPVCFHREILSSCFLSFSKFFVDFQSSFSSTLNAALSLALPRLINIGQKLVISMMSGFIVRFLRVDFSSLS